jgi:hypothetical protein
VTSTDQLYSWSFSMKNLVLDPMSAVHFTSYFWARSVSQIFVPPSGEMPCYSTASF